METIDELKKWLNEIGNHYSALKELNQFTDYDGYIYSTYETVRKKIDELEKAKIFLQPDVSINEGLQSKNKKMPEVALPFSDFEVNLYAKCKEQFPDMTNEEFEDALTSWIWKKEKQKQIEEFEKENDNGC